MKIGTMRSGLALASALLLVACGGGEEAAEDGAATEQTGESTTARSDRAAGTGPLAGWMVRTDRGDTVPTEGRFTATDGGFRIRPGPRTIFFHPDSTASGRFRLSATFHRLAEPRGPEAYGLFLGGSGLKGSGQDYLYFLIRKDGSYLVKHRAGAETHTVVEWTASPAVRTSAGDTVSNTLSVASDSAEVRFLVNGETVRTLPRSEMLRTEGIVGVRINHGLDVRVRDFGTGPLDGESRGSSGE